MDILSRVFEYTFSWDLVGELGEPGPCGLREETPEDLLVVDPWFQDGLA